MERVERSVEVDAPVESVFELLSEFENFPRWMRNLKEVRRTGKRRTLWRADTAVGTDIVWETETTVYEPDHRLAWRSIEGDVEMDGEVILSETRKEMTLLRIVLGYGTPAGRSGAAAARFYGRSPSQQLDEDLARFIRLAERHGDARRTRFEEEQREARSERSRARVVRDVHELHDAREREAMARGRETTGRERNEPVRQRGETERERDETGREHRPRYALSPRERESERERAQPQRRAEYGEVERLTRRGVDRLLDDEAPSRRWRRRD